MTSFTIRHLAEGSNYVFQVRAIAPQGAGRLAEILLTTPLRPDSPRRKKAKAVKNKIVERGSEAAAATAVATATAMATAMAREELADADLTTSNYSFLNNLDAKMLMGARKSPSSPGEGVGGEDNDPAPSHSPSSNAFSFAILILPFIVAEFIL